MSTFQLGVVTLSNYMVQLVTHWFHKALTSIHMFLCMCGWGTI